MNLSYMVRIADGSAAIPISPSTPCLMTAPTRERRRHGAKPVVPDERAGGSGPIQICVTH
jgi:hypothetical protein